MGRRATARAARPFVTIPPVPDFLVPVAVRAVELALYAMFVAVPTVITREPVARRIRGWSRARAVLVYALLGAVVLLCVRTAVRYNHQPTTAGFWWMLGGAYLAEALLFVRYVRSEHMPGFVRARRRGDAAAR